MPGQTRDELLTETERERLNNRRGMNDKKMRAANDARVRKKLTAWLKNIPDVLLILDKLPDDQKRDVISDMNIFALLEVVERMLYIKEFHSIYGEFRDPNHWGVTETCGDSRSYRVDTRSLQSASDLDIARSEFLSEHVENIEGFLGSNNPVRQYSLTKQLADNPQFCDHLTDGDRAGLERVEEALDKSLYPKIRPDSKKIDLSYCVQP
ncbi:MAG: hypothetical protein HPY61_09375 [Methanotrichaceae archaeon]|nr:hypothetical protein [Methanotrichaceae archaeon]